MPPPEFGRKWWEDGERGAEGPGAFSTSRQGCLLLDCEECSPKRWGEECSPNRWVGGQRPASHTKVSGADEHKDCFAVGAWVKLLPVEQLLGFLLRPDLGWGHDLDLNGGQPDEKVLERGVEQLQHRHNHLY